MFYGHNLSKVVTSWQKKGGEQGFALPMALTMVLIIALCTGILSSMSIHNFKRIKYDEVGGTSYVVAEGALNQLTGQMSVYGPLFDQLAPLSTKPSGYTQYSPSTYTSTNGIPTCVGPACQRDMYPAGGGLLKNVGPLTGQGSSVDSTYSITDQLNYTSPQQADLTLQGVKGWVQLERLDQDTPGTTTVGGNLSSSLAEGGNARKVRYRLTGMSMRSLKKRNGTSVVVSVVEMPVQ